MKIRSLLIGMLASIALVGCTNDDESPLSNEEGKEVAVQFSVNVQGATASRAISDGTGARQLMYAVFEKNSESELVQVIDKKEVNDDSGQLIGDGMPVDIALLNGRTYQVVFWAQNANCDAYTVGNDMKVKVNYEGLNNDESRDAFFATEQITVGTQNSFNVTLNRPFAQVNVGVQLTDFKEAQKIGLDITQSSATIADVPSVIDLVTGNVSENVNVTYDFGDIPNELLKRVDMGKDGIPDGIYEIYKWVSMSYILASTEPTSHQMRFSFRDGKYPNEEGSHLEKEASVTRNYRTNLVGQFLTTPITMVAKIDPRYEDERSGTDKIYYIFDTETVIEDEIFTLTKADYGTWCVFTHPRDNEKNFVVTFDNVTFAGGMYGIMYGEDWTERDLNGRPTVYHPTVYNFNIKDVIAKDIDIANCVTNSYKGFADHMSIMSYLRGNTTLTGCVWTGTTTRNNNPIDDGYGVEIEYADNVAYDCGIPNTCNSTIRDCEIGSMYVWSQAHVEIYESMIGYIRTSAITANTAWGLVIGEGSEVNEIEISKVCSTYTPALTIKSGATVNTIKLNGYPKASIKVEDGAVVREFIP